ncbi:unnamed protein product [Miscanthus lutarioriparius]|uniref:Secreted protein n=1 Tax=Miscanthus lutarioriparius TaxID=422564 RepID=A0A811NQU4_9POAL|nr:unnamed protein product [Miscanthus lutarioriparius]
MQRNGMVVTLFLAGFQCTRCSRRQGLRWGSAWCSWCATSPPTRPERVIKENRAAGVLDNHDEGRRYSQHGVRRFWLSKRRDYMQAMDNVPTDPSSSTPTTK